jgi:hypothetical protein
VKCDVFRAAVVALLLLGSPLVAFAQTSLTTGQAQAPNAVTDAPSSETQPQLETLPVEALQWESLAELSSEANAPSNFASSDGDEGAPDADATSHAGSPASGLSYDGLSPIHNAESVDGLSVEQSFRSGPRGAVGGGARSGSSYSEGAISSFRVLLHDFSAENGGAAGGSLAARTRSSMSGEARAHGGAFVLVRNSLLAATNPFSVVTHYRDGVVTSGLVKPSGSLTQFGGTYSVPLTSRAIPVKWRKRFFAFGSLDLQLYDDKVVSAPATSNFYSLSASQLALLGNRGVTAEAANAALNYLDSLTGVVARHAYRVQGFGRIDAALTARDQLALTYSNQSYSALSGAALGQASDAVVARGTASLGDSLVQIDAETARWAHAFSPRWTNELRAQIAYDLEYETPHAPLPQEPGISPGGYAPQVSIAPNGFAYGTPSNLGRTAYPDELRYQLVDVMRLRMGHHALSVGGDWSRIHDRIAATTNAEGSFLYESGTAAEPNGLVNWITDYTLNVHAYPNAGCSPADGSPLHYFCFNSYTQSFGPSQTEFVMHDFAGFAEDAMRVGNNLTLTLGARYDYTLLPLPQTPNFTLDSDVAALGAPIGGSTATFPEDRNNFAVRFGVAWSPKFVTMHLGYGVFYGRTPGATVRAAITDTALASTTASIRIRPTTEALCPQITSAQQGFGYPCAYNGEPPAAVFQTTSAMLFSRRFRSPSVQRASLTLEREVGKRLSLHASYAMALAVQLPQSVDLNIAPAKTLVEYVLQGGDAYPGLHMGETFVVPFYTARRIAQYGPVTALVSNANSTYHSGSIEARWRGPHGLEVRGSYTFSRAIDYGPQDSATPSTDGQFDPYRDGYDKGLSNQNFPQRFAGDVQYEFRLRRSQTMLRRALDHWRIAAIATAGSGAPYSYNIFGGSYLSGGRETINGSGGATYLPTIGRNTLRLPVRSKVDLRLGREFAAGAHVRLNAFAEAFNLLNSQSLSRVQTRAFLLGTPAETGALPPLVFQDAAAIAAENLGTLPFGTPTSSTTGASRERQVEIGLHARF